jgi:hypothetical protein
MRPTAGVNYGYFQLLCQLDNSLHLVVDSSLVRIPLYIQSDYQHLRPFLIDNGSDGPFALLETRYDQFLGLFWLLHLPDGLLVGKTVDNSEGQIVESFRRVVGDPLPQNHIVVFYAC